MDTLLAVAMALLALVVFLVLWKSVDWFDQIITE